MPEFNLQPMLDRLDWPGFDSSSVIDESVACAVVPLESIWAMANRLLRPQFPVTRDRQQLMQLVGKGVVSPRFNKTTLEKLPMLVLIQLAQGIFKYSCSENNAGKEKSGSLVAISNMDGLLAWWLTSEMLLQFDALAMVYEDLALLGSHSQGREGLHSAHYNQELTPTGLQTLLKHHGFSDFPWSMATLEDTSEKESHKTSSERYWRCRQLSFPMPWSDITAAFSQSSQDVGALKKRYPYLYRCSLLAQRLRYEESTPFLTTWLDEPLDWQGVCGYLPWFETWLGSVVKAVSVQAHVAVPIRRLVLVEGSTEEIILPKAAQCLGGDFHQLGIHIESVGGKNQMLAHYVHQSEQWACPICVILDRDAESLMPDLAHYQRAQDQLILLEQGELEDLYSIQTIVQTINRHYQPYPPLERGDYEGFCKETEVASQTVVLNHVFQYFGWGTFDKVRFAQQLSEELLDANQLSPSMQWLITQLLQLP